jgi:hypothetical protein
MPQIATTWSSSPVDHAKAAWSVRPHALQKTQVGSAYIQEALQVSDNSQGRRSQLQATVRWTWSTTPFERTSHYDGLASCWNPASPASSF